MSGGHFNYKQWALQDIANDIDELIATNDSEEDDGWGGTVGYHLPPEVMEKFKETSHWLKRASEMVQRVDWLVSGDDGEESFISRWAEEVRKP